MFFDKFGFSLDTEKQTFKKIALQKRNNTSWSLRSNNRLVLVKINNFDTQKYFDQTLTIRPAGCQLRDHIFLQDQIWVINGTTTIFSG